jgi:hypothetical protein
VSEKPEQKKIDTPDLENEPAVKVAEPKSVAGPELQAALDKAVPMVLASQYQEASELFKSFLEPGAKTDDFDRALAQASKAGYSGLAVLKTRMIAAINASPSKYEAAGFFKKNVTGKMKSADERAIHIIDPRVKAEFAMNWKSISVEDLLKLAAGMMGTPPSDAGLGLAALLYGQNQDEAARQALRSGGKPNNHPDAAPLLAAIDARDIELKARKRKELNEAAEKTYNAANDAMMQGNVEETEKHIKTLNTSFANSDFYRDNKAGIESLSLTLKAITTQGAVIVKGNVALNANANSDNTRYPRRLTDGVTTGYTGSEGFAIVSWPGEMDITLPKLYVLRQIRLLLWDGEAPRFYRYNVEVSSDGKIFTPVGDHSLGEWRSWQTLDMPPQAVKYIRLKGLFNSANGGFHCVELEAYCIPPAEAAVPKYPSRKAIAKGLDRELK